jgi:hypothetical protein
VVSVEARDGGLVLALQPPPSDSDGGAPLTAYRVRLEPGGAVRDLAVAGPWALTGLTNGRAYRVAVAAVNVVGEGPLVAHHEAVTPQPGRCRGWPASLRSTLASD